MKIIYSLLRLIGLVGISVFSINACSTMSASSVSDISIEVEIAPKANFNGYNSYTWIEGASIMYDPMGQWEPPGFDADAEVVFLIDRELRAKGMSESSSNPDILIGFAAGIDMAKVEYKENPEKNFKSLEAAPEGAIVILMVDADTDVIIWAGTATADIQGNTDLNIKKRLDYVVTQMLKKLPK